jgi:hypothetical protein
VDEFFDASEHPSEADAGEHADQESGESSKSSIAVIAGIFAARSCLL